MDCRSSFMSPRNVKFSAACSSSESSEVDLAFECLHNILIQDKTKIWNSVELFNIYKSEGGDRLSRRKLLENLCGRIGDDLLVLTANGVASLIVFKSKAPGLLKLMNDTEDSDITTAVKHVGRQIIREITTGNVESDKTSYTTRLTREKAEDCVSTTLMQLLANISIKLDNTAPALLIGNIVTNTLTNVPTPLQIAIGISVRDSKDLVNQLNAFRVSCTYDELRRFKKSAAVAATSETKLQGISDCKDGLIQVVIDNFDADISSQNGKRSTHSLAMLVTQPSSEDADPECESIRRLAKSDLSDPIEYDTNVQYYNGPKKSQMPENSSRKSVLSLKVLAEMVLSQNRAHDLDTSFMGEVTDSDKCPEFNGYNTKLSRQQGHGSKTKTKAVYDRGI